MSSRARLVDEHRGQLEKQQLDQVASIKTGHDA